MWLLDNDVVVTLVARFFLFQQTETTSTNLSVIEDIENEDESILMEQNEDLLLPALK